MLFQVFTIDFVAADSMQFGEVDLTMAPPLDETLVELWPSSRAAIEWPGDMLVDRSSLPMVIRGHV